METNLLLPLINVIAIAIIFYLYRNRKKTKEAASLAAKKELQILTHQRQPERAEALATRVFHDIDLGRVQTMFDDFQFMFMSDVTSSFTLNPDPQAIEKVVRKVFPTEQQSSVIVMLDKYGKKGESGKGRIQLDIIKLSKGDISKIEGLVRQANSDFRDVLLPAENTIFMTMLSKSSMFDPSSIEYQEVDDADLRQFGLWILQSAY